MRIFQIEGSSTSPRVWLDEKSGIVEISGVSTFHNPFHFYHCLARWIHAFNLGEHKTHVVNMKFECLDEESRRGMEFILQQLDLLLLKRTKPSQNCPQTIVDCWRHQSARRKQHDGRD